MDRVKLDIYQIPDYQDATGQEQDATGQEVQEVQETNPAPESDTPQSANIKAVREKLEQSRGQAYWQSLEELVETPEFEAFMESEFPRQAAPFQQSVNRRDFMKLLGGSLALAGLSACARPPLPNEKIVPYVRAPEEIIPGVPLFYSSTLTMDGFAHGVIAESHQGRPTKVEGNPDHPASLGATDVFMQAAVLDIYDPDRSQTVLRNGGASSWQDFEGALQSALSNLSDGSRLRILSEATTSPAIEHQVRRLQETYSGLRWHQYSPARSDNVRAGAQVAFDKDVVPAYDFAKAAVVVSLDADFLGDGAGKLAYTRAFSSRRRIRSAEDADNKNRFYAFESTPSITGSMADHRVATRAAYIDTIARILANRLGLEVDAGIMPADQVPHELIDAIVEDLHAHEGSSIVIAGDGQPASVHALVHALNYVLGNAGETVFYHKPAVSEPHQLASLRSLMQDIDAGEVDMLLIVGGNPAYSAPADLAAAEAIASVPFSAHLSTYVDETSSRSTWHLPQTHDLEVWGDARAFDGTISLSQPLISPFVEGKSTLEVLAMALGEGDKDSYDIVREYWEARVDGNVDGFWREVLYQGCVPDTSHAPETVELQTGALAEPPRPAPQGLELVFRPDPTIYDGRYANNGWLQETPKPFTKLTWDNAALISPRLAERFELSSGDVVELQVGDLSVEAPVWVQPGQATETVTVHLGYGRTQVGHVGEGAGFNAYKIRSSNHPWMAEDLELRKTRARQRLASTQMHQQIEQEREIVRHGTVAELKNQPERPHFVHPTQHHDSDLYDDYLYEGYAWGMVIDMNTCTGCNACVTACQAENNIPIVGKEQVGRGREMHWLRIDTFYGGDLDSPSIHQMPIACMHCEKAPCEPVCPVGATVHDHEGLNVMVYNRCVGTRYCSNNCPYKVRRFNWLQYAELDSNATSMAMQKNPNVTVRSRGVMEKCTYCTQRIAEARIRSNNENRRISDGEVVTACQAACPAQAIVFGDLSDADSQVVATKKSPLNYGMLTELNTYPRTSYLAQTTNPHPSLAPAVHAPAEATPEAAPAEHEEAGGH